MKLYNYYRSSASYRVRIALHWKELQFEYVPVALLTGQQNTPEYRKVNPMGHVPALEHEGFLIAESMAILEYLDDVFPTKKLFPAKARDKATVIQLCEVVNSGIQPLQNQKVQKFLEGTFSLNKDQSSMFIKHWILDGLSNLEKIAEKTAGQFIFGDAVTAADCFLVPQMFAARRFGVAPEMFPVLARANANATALPGFKSAHPEQQPDYKA